MAGVGAELMAGFGGESCKKDNQPAKQKIFQKATLFASKSNFIQSKCLFSDATHPVQLL